MERLRGQRRGAKKIPPDHLYSSTLIWGIVKNQNPKRVCGRPVTSRIAPTASRSVSSADPHSWYPPPSGGVSRRQPVLPHPLSDQRPPCAQRCRLPDLHTKSNRFRRQMNRLVHGRYACRNPREHSVCAPAYSIDDSVHGVLCVLRHLSQCAEMLPPVILSVNTRSL